MPELKIFRMGLLGIPQERIAMRLGMEQANVAKHLFHSSELKDGINKQLKAGFGINTIAEKLGWPEPLIWAVLLNWLGIERGRHE